MHNTPKRSCSVHIVIKSISVCIWINKNNISGMPTDRSTNRQTAFDLNKETTECVIISKPCAHSIFFFFVLFVSFKMRWRKKTHRHTHKMCVDWSNVSNTFTLFVQRKLILVVVLGLGQSFKTNINEASSYNVIISEYFGSKMYCIQK